MRPELPGEHVQDPLPHPSPLGEGGEGEVVGIDLAQTWKIKEWFKLIMKFEGKFAKLVLIVEGNRASKKIS